MNADPFSLALRFGVGIQIGNENDWSSRWTQNGAGDEIRTHDSHLGKVVLYQLSYARE